MADPTKAYTIAMQEAEIRRLKQTLQQVCEEAVIRLTDLFNRYERPTYSQSSNPDDDLALLLATFIEANPKTRARKETR